jgi:2-dehydropantoate 2-reductase
LLKSELKNIDIISRKETATLLKHQGLKRTGIFGNYYAQSSKFGNYSSLYEVPKKIYDFILVCIKSSDSEFAAQDISNHTSLIDHKTKVVLFQNGWGNAEIFLRCFSRDNVCNARVITGFYRPKKNEVNITVHADSIHIGSLFSDDPSPLEELSKAIDLGGIPCELTQKIEKDLWAKMLYNCALNPLGAIFRVPYGVLGELEYSRKIVNKIFKEIYEVMNAAGYSTHWNSAEEYKHVFYEKFLPATAAHESSTLQDIEAKKKTEIDFLTGAVVKLAERFKIDVPFNSTVYNMVKFIESRNRE